MSLLDLKMDNDDSLDALLITLLRDGPPFPAYEELLLLRQLEKCLCDYSVGVSFMSEERPKEILEKLRELRKGR